MWQSRLLLPLSTSHLGGTRGGLLLLLRQTTGPRCQFATLGGRGRSSRPGDGNNTSLNLLQRRWTQSEPKMTFQPTGLKVKAAPKESGIDWFATPQGRKGSLVLVAIFATGVAAVIGGPHTFGQEFVKELYQHYSKGFRTKVSKEMVALIEEVMASSNLTNEEVNKTKVFVGYSLEAGSWGCYKSAGGVLIAYPHHLHYKSPKEVDLEKMKLDVSTGSDAGYKHISGALMESEEAKSLRQSMCLSKEAKKFVVAREIENGRIGLYRTLVPQAMLFSLSAYACCRLANRRLGLFARPRLLRAINYVAVGSVLGLVWILLYDEQRNRAARHCDEVACRLGAEYCRGGVEYYDKILQRHIALRSLMPNGEGKKRFNLKGDFFTGLVRTKVPPVSSRKLACEKAAAAAL